MMSMPPGGGNPQISTNYNGGWNAYWMDAAIHARPPYAAAQYGGQNYPTPVSFYLVGAEVLLR